MLVTDYGILPTNHHKENTDKLNQLFIEVSNKGGGRVEFPAGKYSVTSLLLQSNVNLHLQPGATLFFDTNNFDYPVVNTRWEGVDRPVYRSLLFADHAENVSISGSGIIDGNGFDWWKLFREDRDSLLFPRPTTVCFNQCKKVSISGVTIQNSPSWTLHPLRSTDVVIDKVSIYNPDNSPNTDGIDPEACENVRISNCFISVGDDCIAIKAGTEGATEKIPCKNICIDNCVMLRGHGGVVIGSEMSGNVENVVVSNCVFNNTDRGIRLKTRRGRGGEMKKMIFSNIIMDGVMCPIVMNLYYFCGPGGKEKYVWDKNPYPITEETPKIENISISNIKAIDATSAAGFIYGLPESPIRNIKISNVDIQMKTDGEKDFPAMMNGIDQMSQAGFWLGNVVDSDLSGITITNAKGDLFTVFDCQNVQLPK